MDKSLLGMKVAMLLANGFSQDNMIAAQKALNEASANVRVVSPENGLVNGWDGQSWGHHFAVDTSLSTTLAADYSALVIPGGQRSIDKLNLTAHTKRFISSFMASSKPVIVMDDALHIMILTDNIKGRIVSGPANMRDVVMQAGGEWNNKAVYQDNALFTGAVDAQNRTVFISDMINHLSTSMVAKQAA